MPTRQLSTQHSTLSTLVLALLLCGSLHAGEAPPKSEIPWLTILFTAEAHAALLPCDCPLQPLGGVARRASAIQKYRRRGPVLLVDGGGWGAGGMYDEESDGDSQRDRMRTKLMAEAMTLMQYDFIAASPGTDDDLLLSADYEVVNAEGDNIGILLIKLLAGEKDTRLLRRKVAVWDRRAPPDQFTLQLSRLGEDAAPLPRADLTLNAGRKISQRLAWRAPNGQAANFDFQAQRLVVAEIFSRIGGYEVRMRHEPLTAAMPDDPAVAALLAPHLPDLKKRGREQVDIEFWTMPACPGCREARPDLERVARDLAGRANVLLRFVVNKKDGKFTSLHGDGELNEARVQTIVQRHYPERIWDWLAWREKNPAAPWEDGARTLNLLAARIRGALVSGEADALLEADYDLSRRRRIDGTPTLVLANRTYDQPLERPQILRVLCALLNDPKPGACKDVPACFFDAQCRKRGFIGKCLNPGKPNARCDTSRPALKVPATVVIDGEALASNHERIMEVLVADLPGIEFTVVDVNDPAGRELAARAELPRLPAYLIDKTARDEAGFAENVGKVVYDEPKTKALALKPFAVGANRLLNRPRVKGRVDLFVARFSKNGHEALETALEITRELGPAAPQLVLHDTLYWNQAALNEGRRELAAAGGLAELEEAARAQAVRKLAPEKLTQYLLERGKRRGSSYWDVAVKAVGLDPEKVRALAEGPGDEILKALQAEADLLKSLDAGGEITLLAENCELISIASRQDLRQTLEKIAQRK